MKTVLQKEDMDHARYQKTRQTDSAQKCYACLLYTSFATNYAIVNVSALDKFNDGDTVNLEKLMEAGIIRKPLDGLKAVSYTHLDVYKRQVPVLSPARPFVR